ncbi:MAG: 16S rRNA (guanine(966)-N(2))-methyltransferase RsmD [Candidatus Omnitrophota bacterium]
MRIIAGEHKGRKIHRPASVETRPTKDRIREAVFNIIAAHVPNADVLDIFAGSGAYGLEALSRGAERAIFVENDKECVDTIKKNIDLLDLNKYSEIMDMDAFRALGSIGESADRFDLVFADPPYNKNLAKKTLIIVNQYDILRPVSFFILEHHKDENIPGSEGNVSLFRQKSYGEIVISIFKKK